MIRRSSDGDCATDHFDGSWNRASALSGCAAMDRVSSSDKEATERDRQRSLKTKQTNELSAKLSTRICEIVRRGDTFPN